MFEPTPTHNATRNANANANANANFEGMPNVNMLDFRQVCRSTL